MDGENQLTGPAELVKSFKETQLHREEISKEHEELDNTKWSMLNGVDDEYSRAVREARERAEKKREAIKDSFRKKMAPLWTSIEEDTEAIKEFRRMLGVVSRVGITARKVEEQNLSTGRDAGIFYFKKVIEHPAINLSAIVVKNANPVNKYSLYLIGESIATSERFKWCAPVHFEDYSTSDNWDNTRRQPQFNYELKTAHRVDELEGYLERNVVNLLKANKVLRNEDVQGFIDAAILEYKELEEYKEAGYTLEAFKDAFAVWCPHCHNYHLYKGEERYEDGELCRACKEGHVECH